VSLVLANSLKINTSEVNLMFVILRLHNLKIADSKVNKYERIVQQNEMFDKFLQRKHAQQGTPSMWPVQFDTLVSKIEFDAFRVCVLGKLQKDLWRYLNLTHNASRVIPSSYSVNMTFPYFCKLLGPALMARVIQVGTGDQLEASVTLLPATGASSLDYLFPPTSEDLESDGRLEPNCQTLMPTRWYRVYKVGADKITRIRYPSKNNEMDVRFNFQRSSMHISGSIEVCVKKMADLRDAKWRPSAYICSAEVLCFTRVKDRPILAEETPHVVAPPPPPAGSNVVCVVVESLLDLVVLK
jgi:hypothetical protein